MEFPRKTFWTLTSMVAMVVGLEYAPELKHYVLLDWDDVDQVVEFRESRLQPREPIAEAVLKLKPGTGTVKAGVRGQVEPLSDPASSRVFPSFSY